MPCKFCDNVSRPVTRRQMLQKCSAGFGMVALAGLLGEQAAGSEPNPRSPLYPRPPMFPARAKRIIFLFMHGGPSQVDTFDPKPLLIRDNGKSAGPIGKVSDDQPRDGERKWLGSP